MNRQDYHEICEWQNRTFTKATPLSCAKHLREEVQELINDLETDNIKLEEVADCFLLLIGVCNKMHLEYETIDYIIQEKMKINLKREWEQTDKGYMKHKKP